jgi:hypothetical protein
VCAEQRKKQPADEMTPKETPGIQPNTLKVDVSV